MRTSVAVVAALIAGVLAVPLVFSDISPAETRVGQWVLASLCILAWAAALIMLAPRRWWLATLAALVPVGQTAQHSVAGRLALAVLCLAGAGLLVGWLTPKRWWLALIAAWSSVGMGSLLLLGKLRTGNTPPYWSAIVTGLVVAPLIALAAGYLGRHRRIKPRAAEARLGVEA